MKNVSDEILRQIGTHKDWTKKYGVVANLVKNPRTPLGISLSLVSRLNPRDIKGAHHGPQRAGGDPQAGAEVRQGQPDDPKKRLGMADYYAILGVPRTATAAEIRQAYARSAREQHPDRFADPAQKEQAQEFFKDITAAFNTLSNEKSRREYDAEPGAPARGGAGGDRARRLRARRCSARGQRSSTRRWSCCAPPCTTARARPATTPAWPWRWPGTRTGCARRIQESRRPSSSSRARAALPRADRGAAAGPGPQAARAAGRGGRAAPGARPTPRALRVLEEAGP